MIAEYACRLVLAQLSATIDDGGEESPERVQRSAPRSARRALVGEPRETFPGDDLHSRQGGALRHFTREERFADSARTPREDERTVPIQRLTAARDGTPDGGLASYEARAEEVSLRRAAARPRGLDMRAESHEHGGHVIGLTHALSRVARKETHDEFVQLSGYFRHEVRRACGRVVLPCAESLVALRAKRRLAGEALVDHATERVEIRARVRDLAAYDLRRKVRERAARAPGNVQPFASNSATRLRREPEIHEHGVIAVAHEHVRRLEVTMNDPGPVNEGERGAQPRVQRYHFGQPSRRSPSPAGVDSCLRRAFRRDGLASQIAVTRLQSLTLEKLHRVPRNAAVKIIL